MHAVEFNEFSSCLCFNVNEHLHVRCSGSS